MKLDFVALDKPSVGKANMRHVKQAPDRAARVDLAGNRLSHEHVMLTASASGQAIAGLSV